MIRIFAKCLHSVVYLLQPHRICCGQVVAEPWFFKTAVVQLGFGNGEFRNRPNTTIL